MSAIYGIVDSGGRPINPSWLQSMRADLLHRGPDGEGLWQEGPAGLGRLRLQVTPESAFEQSPCLEVEGLVVSADARLDEREALMDKLGLPAGSRREMTDPELIGLAYRRWKDACPAHLLGDFAFAIWDKQAQRLFCARDHLGVKPFLYVWKEGIFAWSTEMKALARLPLVGGELSRAYQLEYLAGIHTDLSSTIWQDVLRLPQAHALILESGRLEVRRYWNYTDIRDVRFSHPEQYVDAFRDLLQQAVYDRLRTDYPVGCALSGGLDSSAVTCIAAAHLRERGRKIFTCSAVLPRGYEGPGKEEREYMEAVAASVPNMDLQYEDEEGLSYAKNLWDTFGQHYQPVNSFYYLDASLIARLRNKNVKRALSGDFGDVAASNSLFKVLPYLFGSGRFLAMARHFSRRKAYTGKSALNLLKNEVILPFLPLGLLTRYRRWQGEPLPLDISDIPVLWKPGEQEQILAALAGTFYNRKRLNYLQGLWAGTEDYFAEDFDVQHARYKMEPAYPLADKRIVEFILGIPPEILQYKGVNRGLFRKAIEDIVPPLVVNRRTKNAYSPRYREILVEGFRELKPLLLESSPMFLEAETLFDLQMLREQIFDLEMSEKNANIAKRLIPKHLNVMLFGFHYWYFNQNRTKIKQ